VWFIEWLHSVNWNANIDGFLYLICTTAILIKYRNKKQSGQIEKIMGTQKARHIANTQSDRNKKLSQTLGLVAVLFVIIKLAVASCFDSGAGPVTAGEVASIVSSFILFLIGYDLLRR
jgi:hypothetical protein